ncbi:MAG: STAS domain-containing protein [Chloroflexi bacterium]|nr:STAS domain-containing protein [Chloroflexota bacterium]MCI0581218.1 STAS domain-containing protein [Chloroflexota bacterium]MCI0644077.1 STAS domain-containing protein [Chloroflexota bacterium]MCI0727893.1 STAS domain-containing protein [Chloroflexota bacterium]
MEVTVNKQGQVTVVTIVGSLDALTAGEVASFLSDQIRQGEIRLVADFSQVDYITSAGLRTILATLKEARSQGGDLRLAGAQPNVHKVLQMSGFTNILKFYPEMNAAVVSFSE